MNILWVATKAPWPAVDGGRLLMRLTLEALAEMGHKVTVVAPARPGDPAVPGESAEVVPKGVTWLPVEDDFRPKAWDLLKAWPRGRAFSFERHRSLKTAAAVDELVQKESFDVVHVEQVQALGNVASWIGSEPKDGLPVVLRAQNVESDLWRLLAAHRPLIGSALRWEARLLARTEAKAVRECGAVAALTQEDARTLSQLAGGQKKVTVIPPPFPSQLPAAHGRLDGEPALVIFGSSGWIPNREGTDGFLRSVWPELARRQPGAKLHLFGCDVEPSAEHANVEHHPAPDDSRDAFAPGSILVVPLSIASGIRMKILEAWARGVPVIATPTAAAGLGATHGEHLFEAQTAQEFVTAVQELAKPDRYREMVEAGRERLRQVHAPRVIAEAWVRTYAGVLAPANARGRSALEAAASMARVASSSDDSA